MRQAEAVPSHALRIPYMQQHLYICSDGYEYILQEVQLLETGSAPLVYAQHLHAPGKPTALIYGEILLPWPLHVCACLQMSPDIF